MQIKYKHFYVLKCDISKFFASINHGILKEKLFRRIKDKEKLQLNIKTRIYKDNDNFTFLGRNSNGHYIRYRTVKRKLKNKYYYYQKGYIPLNEFVSSLVILIY